MITDCAVATSCCINNVPCQWKAQNFEPPSSHIFQPIFLMGLGVTGIYIIITKPTCSTGSHNVIIVLAKFFLLFVSTVDTLDRNKRPLCLLLDIHWWWWWWWWNVEKSTIKLQSPSYRCNSPGVSESSPGSFALAHTWHPAANNQYSWALMWCRLCAIALNAHHKPLSKYQTVILISLSVSTLS